MDANQIDPAPQNNGQANGPGGSGSRALRIREFGRRALAWLRRLPAVLKQFGARIRRPRMLATVGGTAAAVVAVALLAIPGGPERQQRQLELSGKDLFLAIQAQQPGTERSSRVREGDDRGTGTNLIVLSETTWQTLSIDQRNSLGSWLNALGGRWEIRVGRANEDQTRVLDAEPMITDEAWNQQLK